VTFFFVGAFGRGRTRTTCSVISLCQATRVPGAGDWAVAMSQVLFVLPGPTVLKYSCAARIAAYTSLRVLPTRRGTGRGPRGEIVVTVTLASPCQAMSVPGRGDCAATAAQWSFALPGPRVTK
jgi:hypothetical protein